MALADLRRCGTCANHPCRRVSHEVRAAPEGKSWHDLPNLAGDVRRVAMLHWISCSIMARTRIRVSVMAVAPVFTDG